MNDVQKIDEQLTINITSMLCLNSAFLSVFPSDAAPRYVVNITSLAGIEPCITWGLYCATKAAREMLMKVFAKENPSVNVLQYSPGPVDTDMQLQCRTETADEEFKEVFRKMHEEKKLVTCEETVGKLV